jgi:hypothetical protein
MNLGRTERQYASFPLTGTLDDGTPADLTNVAVALLPRSTTPRPHTTWTPATITDGRVRVLLAGPDAPTEGALTVPDGGGELWVQVTDTPEVDTARVDRVLIS